MQNDPTNYPLITYIYVAGVAILGGVVNYLQRLQRGDVKKYVIEFLLDILAAILVGLITFWLCKRAGLDDHLTAALIAITSHMGARVLMLFQRWALRRYVP